MPYNASCLEHLFEMNPSLIIELTSCFETSSHTQSLSSSQPDLENIKYLSPVVMSSYLNNKVGLEKNLGTGRGHQFYTHSLKNIGELIDKNKAEIQAQEDTTKEKQVKPKPKTPSYSDVFKSTLEEAKQGGHKAVQKKPQLHKTIQLTAEQLEAAHLALNQVRANEAKKVHDNREAAQRRAEEAHLLAILPPTLPIDINGHPNATSKPVFFQAPDIITRTVSRVPYPISDMLTQCQKCTVHQTCPRHRPRESLVKTDISLCSGNHKRLVLHWDPSDPVNDKGSWRIEAKAYFDRFPNGAADHQRCVVYEAAGRVRALAERVVGDYADVELGRRRVGFVDARGRDDGTAFNREKVERELRVLVMFWQKKEKWEGMSREERRERVTMDRECVEKNLGAEEWVGIGRSSLEERSGEQSQQCVETKEFGLRADEQRSFPLKGRQTQRKEIVLPVLEKPTPKQFSSEQKKTPRSIRHGENQQAQQTTQQEQTTGIAKDERRCCSPLQQDHDNKNEDNEQEEGEIKPPRVNNQPTSSKNKRKRSPPSLTDAQEFASLSPAKKHRSASVESGEVRGDVGKVDDENDNNEAENKVEEQGFDNGFDILFE